MPCTSGETGTSYCFTPKARLVGVQMDTGGEDEADEEGEESDESMKWEEFFGPTIDLVPMLLNIYDTLSESNRLDTIGRNSEHGSYKVRSNGPVLLDDRHRYRPLGSSIGAKSWSLAQRSTHFYRSQSTEGHFRPMPTNDVPDSGEKVFSTYSVPPQSSGALVIEGATDDLATPKCDKRPLSVTSTSSAFSSASSSSSSSSSLSSYTSSSLPRGQSAKKTYLASIESLDDHDDDEDGNDEDECCRRCQRHLHPCAKTNSGGGGGDTTARSIRCHHWTGSLAPTTASNGAPTLCHLITSPAPPQGWPRYCDPNLSYTDRVALEIVETERTYVRDLSEIIEGYLSHLTTGCLQVTISPQSVDELFGNIEDIYVFNREFLKQLEECSLDAVSIAQTFVRHNDGFAIYTEYCTNYPRTVAVLTELMRREATAEIFKERQAALGHMLPLGSYLLKPVQRILKYHLLLQNMVKHYDKEKVGYQDVVNALATMTGIAHHINDMKRKHEHAVRVQEIQSLLYGWEGEDLTTYGELIAEGTFRVYGAKAGRHVFLFDRMLLIAKKKEDSSLSYKTHIMCSNLMLIESISGEPLCFHVIPFDNPRVQYTLQARNLEQKREWTLQLKRVILENYNVDIPSHARELVMQLGQNRPEDEILAERAGAPKKQHSAPEYLERRKQDRERRRVENINKALRIRRGSKKNESLSPLPPSDGRLRNQRSFSCERETSKDRENKPNSSSLTSQKGKKLRGWRRKSEPCDLLSSQESLCRDQSFEQSPTRDETGPATKCPGTPGSFTSSCSRTSGEETPGETTSPLADTALREEETTDDPSTDEYVTFLPPTPRWDQLHRSHSRDHGPEAHIYDVPCARHGAKVVLSDVAQRTGYDNLLGLVPLPPSGGGDGIQRAHSFNSSSCSSNSDCGSSCLRRRPDVLHLPGCVALPQECSPTAPAVWLKQQQGHLADGSAVKAGSLPRSFQLNQETTDGPGGAESSPATDGLASFKLRRSVDRPFTIASDKPSQSDLNLDDFERYIADSPGRKTTNRFPVGGEEPAGSDVTDTSADDFGSSGAGGSGSGVTSPVHPEHRIYRPTLSRSSLRSLLASVGSRLSGLRATTGSNGSCSSLNTDGNGSQGSLDGRSPDREKSSGRLIFSVAHVYSRMVRSHRARLQSKIAVTPSSPDVDRVARSPVPIHKQGSPAIGARMAKPIHQPICGTPCLRRSAMGQCGATVSEPATPKGPRPDSTLSLSSNWTSSSEGETQTVVPTATPEDDLTDDSEDSVPSTGGAAIATHLGDSYYERSFEVIESFLLESDRFRDSAVYSDSEDTVDPPRTTDAPKLPTQPATTATENDHTSVSNGGANRQNRAKEKQGAPLCQSPEDATDQVESRETVKGIIRKMRFLEEEQTHHNNCTGNSSSSATTSSTKENIGNLKPIRERCRDLELWRAGNGRDLDDDTGANRPDATTVGTGSLSPNGSEAMVLRGWVRHVVDKFQSDS